MLCWVTLCCYHLGQVILCVGLSLLCNTGQTVLCGAGDRQFFSLSLSTTTMVYATVMIIQ